MRKLETVSRKLEGPLQVASNIFLILILAFVFSEVVSRYIFAQSHGFMEDFSKWSQIWLAYLMLGVIDRGRRHIAVDVLPRRLPERYKTALLIVLDIVVLSFAIILCWSGIESTIVIKKLGLLSGTEINTPMWIVRLCVPLGAMFLAFFSIQHLATDIVSLGKHRGSEE